MHLPCTLAGVVDTHADPPFQSQPRVLSSASVRKYQHLEYWAALPHWDDCRFHPGLAITQLARQHNLLGSHVVVLLKLF